MLQWPEETERLCRSIAESARGLGVQTVAIRALQWLARRDVTWPVPADFPTAEKMSVRGEVALPAGSP